MNDYLKKKGVDLSNINGYSISEEAFVWLFENLEEGKTIFEIGAGKGTKELCKFWNVISVESEKKYMNISDAQYIHVPLKGGKYDYDVLRKHGVPDYDLLIVDGPTGSPNRVNILDNLDLFDKDKPIIVDDTHADVSKKIATKISFEFGKTITHHKGFEKIFTTLT